MDATPSTAALPVRPLPAASTKRKHSDVSAESQPSSSDQHHQFGPPPATASFSTILPKFSFEAPMHGIVSPFPQQQQQQASPELLLPGNPASMPGGLAHAVSDGGSSPRTNVAHHFTSLAIADPRWQTPEGAPPGQVSVAGKGSTNSIDMEVDEDDSSGAPTKRRRTEMMMGLDGQTATSSPPPEEELPATEAATPRAIVDPVRASLTWQDDEITVYDPDDADDDGTGVNGIGFKPTPAIARARALKRRQQLVEYRKREEREARARRSLQRRSRAAAAAAAVKTARAQAEAEEEERRATGAAAALAATMAPSTAHANGNHAADPAASTLASSSSPGPETVRRVRFLETGPTTIRFLEPEPATIMTS